jgi:hypothetical protein
MMDSVIVGLEKAAIVIHREPAFVGMFIGHLLARAIRVEADLVDQLFNSSERRLARLLLLLANFGKDEKPARENQPGDTCGYDRHDPVPGEFLHEQTSKTGSY